MTNNVEMIERIQELLGSDCSLADAAAVYHSLRAESKISYDDAQGLVLVDGVDLLAEATESLGKMQDVR